MIIKLPFQVRRKVEIREQLALLVQGTEEEEEEKEMKRHHTGGSTGTVAENEKRARQEELGAPALSEPVTHFNETEAVTELHYDDDVNPTVSHFNEALAPEVELHYKSQGTPSSSSPMVDSSLTDGWELVDGEGGGDGDRFGAEGNAPSSIEPSSLPGPTVSQELATRSTSIKPTPKHSKPSKPSSQTSSSCREGQTSKSQPKECLEASLGEKMKKGRWKSTELNGHEDLVLDCDLNVQLGLAVTCSRDTTVKVRWEIVMSLTSWNLPVNYCNDVGS